MPSFPCLHLQPHHPPYFQLIHKLEETNTAATAATLPPGKKDGKPPISGATSALNTQPTRNPMLVDTRDVRVRSRGVII
jgi:hypothetical protein